MTALTLLTVVGWQTAAHAQLLVNFQASTYTGGSTWTGSQSGVVATADPNTTSGNGSGPVASGGSVTTSNGGFLFNTSNVPTLDGKTSYTLAIGFTATNIPNGFGGVTPLLRQWRLRRRHPRSGAR